MLAERHRWRVGGDDAASHDADEDEEEPRRHGIC
jgi:hypothetical protein